VNRIVSIIGIPHFSSSNALQNFDEMVRKMVQEQLSIKMQNMGTKIKEELIVEMRVELQHETMMYFAKMSANIGIHSLLFLNLLVQYLRNFNEM
jgi:predicted DNA-binding helix-hairpin-helix protein